MTDVTACLTNIDIPARSRTAPDAAAKVRDAASLILIDRSSGVPRVLVGRRASAHAFMPDLYVFPGGRRDPRDHSLPFSRDLRDDVVERLLAATSARMTATSARALALAAVRELREETGLDLACRRRDALSAPLSPGPDLSKFRYVARAITPPGNVRRFDTRFFAVFADETDLDLTRMADSSELIDLQWLALEALGTLPMPDITLVVLRDLKTLLETDASLPFGSPVNLYSRRSGQFVRRLL